jgi:hypothetical protein
VRRREPATVECAADLIRFDAAQWPASARDVRLKGEGEREAFPAWQRWMHARADFADAHGVAHGVIPYEVPGRQWSAVLESLAT